MATDPLLPDVSELRFELPYQFEHAQYRQLLHDFITLIAPKRGWLKNVNVVPAVGS